MSVKITIDLSERNLKEMGSNWVSEQIERRRDANVPVCARVFIKYDDIDLVLGTNDCNSSKGKSRKLTISETEIIDMWDSLSLSDSNFSSSNLIIFLKRLKA